MEWKLNGEKENRPEQVILRSLTNLQKPSRMSPTQKQWLILSATALALGLIHGLHAVPPANRLPGQCASPFARLPCCREVEPLPGSKSDSKGNK